MKLNRLYVLYWNLVPKTAFLDLSCTNIQIQIWKILNLYMILMSVDFNFFFMPAQKIHISSEAYLALIKDNAYELQLRGEIEIKVK